MRIQVESTWDTLLLSSSQPAHISVFSPVDSLNKAMLNIEGVSVPAAKYSVVWSGQNATEEMIPSRQSCNDEVRGRAVGQGTAILTLQTILCLFRRSCVKPRPFVVTRSVNVEHLNRVFETAIYSTKS